MDKNPREAEATMREESLFTIVSDVYPDVLVSRDPGQLIDVTQDVGSVYVTPSAARLLAEALVKLADQVEGGA